MVGVGVASATKANATARKNSRRGESGGDGIFNVIKRMGGSPSLLPSPFFRVKRGRKRGTDGV